MNQLSYITVILTVRCCIFLLSRMIVISNTCYKNSFVIALFQVPFFHATDNFITKLLKGHVNCLSLNLSFLSEKTRKSKHLQMKLQRQHFLLRSLKNGK